MRRYLAISITTFYKSMNEKNMMIFFIWCVRLIFIPKLCSPLVLPNNLIAFQTKYFAKSLARNKLIYLLLLVSGISDHFPCIVNFKILNKRLVPPKYIYKRSVTELSIEQYRVDLRNLNIYTHLNAYLVTDPNESYQTFENLMQKTYEHHFPKKRVKFNKYQHKLCNWITTGILKSIEFCDILYKRIKLCPIDSPEYEIYRHNLKMYQGYLNQCIRTAKKEYHVKEFTKYKNDIRKTWDTLKGIICKNNMKSMEFYRQRATNIGG